MARFENFLQAKPVYHKKNAKSLVKKRFLEDNIYAV